MKLRYKIRDGYIIAIGYNDILPEVVDETTPFQSISEAEGWRLINGKWERYDPTWHYNFPVRVTIPETVILDNDFYIALISHVKTLILEQRAAQEIIDGKRILYFQGLLPEHEDYLKNDINVIIETKI